MKNNNVHCKDFKIGDVVYIPETEYLNQKHERYTHETWETIETIRVKVIRTVFKRIVNDPVRPFLTAGDVKFRQVFHTFSEAADCLMIHPYLLKKFKIQGAQAFLDSAFNVAKPQELEFMIDAKEMERMR